MSPEANLDFSLPSHGSAHRTQLLSVRLLRSHRWDGYHAKCTHQQALWCTPSTILIAWKFAILRAPQSCHSYLADEPWCCFVTLIFCCHSSSSSWSIASTSNLLLQFTTMNESSDNDWDDLWNDDVATDDCCSGGREQHHGHVWSSGWNYGSSLQPVDDILDGGTEVLTAAALLLLSSVSRSRSKSQD